MSITANHLHTITRHRNPPNARSFAALPTRHPALPPRRRCASAGAGLVVADLGFDTFLPALGIKPEAAVLTSAVLATGSVFINLVGGLQLEQKRAELQLELERDKLFQQQLRELQGVIARYRGPLLESAIDLEQRLWHLVTDQCFEHRSPEAVHQEINYFMFVLAQFLGFVEVVRRENPRERPFLQAGNPSGSDTLSTLVEAVRFVLCAPPGYLEEWFEEGPERPHPGLRKRRMREEVIRRHLDSETRAALILYPDSNGNGVVEEAGIASGSNGVSPSALPSLDNDAVAPDVCGFNADREAALLRVPRGFQRAIGTLMITTPMGAERHYTMSYGDFHTSLESNSSFSRWFSDIEADVLDLATGPAWVGQPPFPVNRWTRVLLLQEILVEFFDILDPDCAPPLHHPTTLYKNFRSVRLPLSRRERLMPIAWGPLPALSVYQKRLKQLSNATDFGGHQSALQGLKQLRQFAKTFDENDYLEGLEQDSQASVSMSTSSSSLSSDSDADVATVGGPTTPANQQQQRQGLTVNQLRREEAGAALRAAVRAAQLEARLRHGVDITIAPSPLGRGGDRNEELYR